MNVFIMGSLILMKTKLFNFLSLIQSEDIIRLFPKIFFVLWSGFTYVSTGTQIVKIEYKDLLI